MSDLAFLLCALGVVALAAWTGTLLANFTERLLTRVGFLSDEPEAPANLPPCLNAEEIGYKHPLAWPTRIVQGVPVAIGPQGKCEQWHSAFAEWWPADDLLAAEARSRLHLDETRADESLPAAEPVLCSQGHVHQGNEAESVTVAEVVKAMGLEDSGEWVAGRDYRDPEVEAAQAAAEAAAAYVMGVRWARTATAPEVTWTLPTAAKEGQTYPFTLGTSGNGDEA